MRATDLSELSAFDAVARHKSFTRAAKEREVTASAVSHAVSNLVFIRNMYPSGAKYPWEFERKGEKIAFNPTGPIALDDHELMVQVALSGTALAYIWERRAEREILEGKLIRCLDEWCAPEDWLYLYYPSRKHMSAGLCAVVEALRV